MIWRCKHRDIDLSRPVVMGILNVTPDSFSDGGRFYERGAALERAASMQREGACIIDIGGESTQPGAQSVPAQTQIDRVVPVIEAVAARFDIAISIDTREPEVMSAAIMAGACIVNDIGALRQVGARALCAQTRVGVVLMHMQGSPPVMQDAPRYADVLAEVSQFLLEQRSLCADAGIDARSIAFDPGLGFGKTFAHNMNLLKETAALVALGSPILMGVSRKSFIGRILDKPALERLYGGLGLAAFAIIKGAKIIRTHDVEPAVDLIKALNAIDVAGVSA